MAEQNNRLSVDVGLFVLRVGIGATFIVHGLPKLVAGPTEWAKFGGTMALFGIKYAPEFWGFMCGFAEAVGGACLVLGLFVRPAAILMFLNMVVATTAVCYGVVKEGKPWLSMGGFGKWAYPLSMAIVFLGLIFIGGGRFGAMKIFKWGGAKKAGG